MPTLPSLLQPAIVNERVSRLKVHNTILQKAFGLQSGGPNVQQTPSRRGSYDVFNDTREIATARLPGTTSGTIARQAVGNVPFTIPESHEKLSILMEEVNQLRALGGPVDGVDSLGERYIADQERIVKQRYTNLREFQVAAMLRGSYTYAQSGDNLTHGFTGGTITIDYQVPSGNKNQLNMTGGGNILGVAWDNAAAPIIRDLLQINAAFEELVGRGLTDVWVSSTVWGFIITNTEVQNLAGSVNDPVESLERDMANNTFTARLKGAPWVRFHIMDTGLNLSGTYTRLIGVDAAVFTTEMGGDIVKMYETCSPVVDPASNGVSNQFGEYFWHVLQADPASYEFHGLYNALPVLFIPAAIAYGVVDF